MFITLSRMIRGVIKASAPRFQTPLASGLDRVWPQTLFSRCRLTRRRRFAREAEPAGRARAASVDESRYSSLMISSLRHNDIGNVKIRSLYCVLVPWRYTFDRDHKTYASHTYYVSTKTYEINGRGKNCGGL